MAHSENAKVRSAQQAVHVMNEQHVPWVFGVPGAKIDTLFDAAVYDGGPEVVVCRHEQNAAFMAAAVGRLTGTPGVVVATSGPGTSNLATGLLTANTEQDPVVAICGAVQQIDRLKRTHQTMNAAAFLGTVTKVTSEVAHPDNVAEAVANAFRAATTEPRGATAVVLPADVGAGLTAAAVHGVVSAPKPGPAAATTIGRAAALIRQAQRPVLLVGLRGASPEAVQALRTVLRGTGLPVAETFQAAGVISRDLEDHYIGRVGLFRNQPADLLIEEADLLVTVGYDPVEYDPELWNFAGGRPIVHLDSVPAAIDEHYQPTWELIGSISETLTLLGSELDGFTVAPGYAETVATHRDMLAAIDAGAREWGGKDGAVNPAALALKIRDLIDDDTTVTCDVGSVYIYMARHFRVYEPRRLLFSNGQQTLGVALPWAMAAKLVRPGAPVVSVSGDGGFLFSAQELETAQRLGLHFVHVIFRDDTYDMVGFQEELKYGRKSAVQLGSYDIPQFAAAFGAHGVTVTDEAEFETVFTAALRGDRTTIIDVRVDYSRNRDLAAHLEMAVIE
jgi:acetolactate synthase-1/2/3 large subunit